MKNLYKHFSSNWNDKNCEIISLYLSIVKKNFSEWIFMRVCIRIEDPVLVGGRAHKILFLLGDRIDQEHFFFAAGTRAVVSDR